MPHPTTILSTIAAAIGICSSLIIPQQQKQQLANGYDRDDDTTDDNACASTSIQVSLTLTDTVSPIPPFIQEGVIDDPDHNLYWFGQRTNNKIIAMDATTHEFIDSLIIESDNINSPMGIIIHESIMYVANDVISTIARFDIRDINHIVELVPIHTGRYHPNGLCLSEEMNMLCYTDVGVVVNSLPPTYLTYQESIWCIDLDTVSSAPAAALRELDDGDDGVDSVSQVNILLSGRGIYPDGCKFRDGKLWTIGWNDLNPPSKAQLAECDFNQVSTFSDIDETSVSCIINELFESYRTDIMNNDEKFGLGNGLVFDKYGVGFVSAFKLDQVNWNDDQGVIVAGYMNKDENGLDTFCAFELVVDGEMSSSGDIVYDEVNDVIVVPEISIGQIQFWTIERRFMNDYDVVDVVERVEEVVDEDVNEPFCPYRHKYLEFMDRWQSSL